MNVAPNFAWTPEAVARMKELADGTRSATEIANTLGCGRNAVIGKMNRMRAAGKLAPTVKLMEGHGSHGRAKTSFASRAAGAPAGRRTVDGVRSDARPAPKKKGAPVAPTLVAPAAFVPIASDHALTLPPITFDEAIERNRCLFFAGDPYSPAGPDMPVCGAERPEWSTGGSRYCTRHRLGQYAPRRAA